MKKLFLSLLFFAAGGTLLSAEKLTWQEIAAIAGEHNTDLRSARANVAAAKAAVRSALGDFLPQIAGNGSYSKSDSALTSEQRQYTLSLTAQQSLFSGFKSKANLDAAGAQLKAAESSLALAESEAADALYSAYLNLLYSQENVRLLEKILGRREENRKLIAIRYQAGRENRGALLRAQAQESQARFELAQAGRALAVARRGLSQALGRDLSASAEVGGDFQAAPPHRRPRNGGPAGQAAPDTEAPDFAKLALETPAYRRSAAVLEESRASLAGARAEFFPSLSISGTGRRQSGDFPPDSDSWNLGASVSFPIFAGGKDYFAVRRSRSNLEKALSDLEGSRRQAEFTLESAFAAVQDAYGQQEVRKAFLEAAEERAKIARAQYGNGLISYQDWDIIEGDLATADKQNLESRRSAALAESAWLKAQGRGFNTWP